ncbi:MMPL family transporter [Levilactobacillus bambusae]|uniref:MMPL family transporter n=1 Tax=Levilactobacillus bambusae TaxID=2024736 RepID=A0A2V1N0T5_9LACO|nr:MMPL family transporter [Levilactobacillus bambusae]PWG00358.1 MMPL family transporter [Levilactobacillus bambusae]
MKFRNKTTLSLIAWLVVVILSVVALPNMSQLVADKGQTKIPASAQSQVADTIQKHWGHNISNTRQVVVVFNNGDHKITTSQQDDINDTITKLQDHKSRYNIKGITAPNDNSATKKQLISKDKTTQLVQLNISKDQSVQKMNEQLSSAVKTHGVKTYVTGSDVLNDDFRLSTEQGIQKTEVIAVIFILIVLILVFRSPVVPLISLLTVGVSFITSLSIVMNLVKFMNFPLSNFTQVFMVVVLFGIGTDYNILLYDQFKEELSKGKDKIQATIDARKVAGKTILYSGLSVLIGFTTLGLAKFSIYQSALGVAVGVAVLLVVLLTLNPFFMALLGKKMFWPSKNFDGARENKLWHGLSASSVLHPFIALALVAILTIPVALTFHNNLNYDTMVELSDQLPAKKGFRIVEKHFSEGTAEPSTIYIKSNHKLDNEKDYQQIDRITKQLKDEKGVKTVASVTQPGGTPINKLYVNDQLSTLNGQLGKTQDGLTKISNGLSSSNGTTTANGLKSIGNSAKDIASQLKAIQSATGSSSNGQSQMMSQLQQAMAATGQPLSASQSQVLAAALQQASSSQQSSLATLQSSLEQIASDTQSIGTNTQSVASELQAAQGSLKEANDGLTKINQGTVAANQYLSGLQNSSASDTFYIPDNVLNSSEFKDSEKAYLSSDKKVAKITVVLDSNPSSMASMSKVDKMQTQVIDNLKGTDLKNATVAIGGQTATISDTHRIASSDFIRTAAIMMIGLFICLLFVTRSVLQPMYILGTLLLAYMTSLGLTQWVSGLTTGQSVLTWNTPFFSFIMLVTLGIDYSIFLMMKYREYGPDGVPTERIVKASGVIGAVVLSAAIILGGTFAALMPSGVLTLIQVAMVVIIGLVLLIFMLPTVISSFIRLTYPLDNKLAPRDK